MGGTLSDTGLGIAVDGNGNVYVTGGFIGTADFDPCAGTFTMTAATTSGFAIRDRVGDGDCQSPLSGFDIKNIQQRALGLNTLSTRPSLNTTLPFHQISLP